MQLEQWMLISSHWT